jgi:hypothetical protein
MTANESANSAQFAEIRARAEDWLAGTTRWDAASPEYVTTQALDILALVEVAEAAAQCARCEDKREVPTTPGQPGDGPMPCPVCADVPRDAWTGAPDQNAGDHRELMRRLKLLPIFRCGYCGLPHPTRFCPDHQEAWRG